MYLVYFHPSNIKYETFYVAEKTINKYLQVAKDEIVEDWNRKRKIDLIGGMAQIGA